jgi:hypothetical protein
MTCWSAPQGDQTYDTYRETFLLVEGCATLRLSMDVWRN